MSAAGWSVTALPQEQRVVHDFRVAISVSPFTELIFRAGITFTDGKVTAKTPEELQRLFIAHYAGDNDVAMKDASDLLLRKSEDDNKAALLSSRGLSRIDLGDLHSETRG